MNPKNLSFVFEPCTYRIQKLICSMIDSSLASLTIKLKMLLPRLTSFTVLCNVRFDAALIKSFCISGDVYLVFFDNDLKLVLKFSFSNVSSLIISIKLPSFTSWQGEFGLSASSVELIFRCLVEHNTKCLELYLLMFLCFFYNLVLNLLVNLKWNWAVFSLTAMSWILLQHVYAN